MNYMHNYSFDFDQQGQVTTNDRPLAVRRYLDNAPVDELMDEERYSQLLLNRQFKVSK